MLKRFLLPIVVIAIAIAVFIGLKQSRPEKVAIHKPEKVWRVDTVAVTFQDISPEIILYGRVETPRNAAMKSALNADVISTIVLEGSEVIAGQLLMTLDDTDAQLLVTQRQADLAEIESRIEAENLRFNRDKGLLEQEKALLQLADKAVKRSKKLEQSRLASQANLDDALAAKQRQVLTVKRLNYDISEHPSRLAQLQASLKRAQALLQQAQVDLERTKITAPFTGRISQLNVSVGDRVRIGDSLLSIYDTENLEVRAQIPGRYISLVQSMMDQGDTLNASSTVDGHPLKLTLKRLSGEVKLDSGGVDGLFGISGMEQTVALGKFIELNLKLASQSNVVAVPFNALYGRDHVYRLKDGHLESVNIHRVGEARNESTGEQQLLLRSSTLEEGDIIVSTQLPNAITGLRVEALSE